MMRALLYEAAQGLLTRVQQWSWLKAWAMNGGPAAQPAKKPSWLWRVAWPLLCTVFGAMAPRSAG
jgi:hypothetical protein